MTSIDGKIDGKFMDEKYSDPVGDYYEDWKNKAGKAWGNGSNTHAKYFGFHEVDYSGYDVSGITYDDYVVLDDEHNYIVTFDTHGKCNWIENTVDYFGISRNLMVLSKATRKEYLAHLRALQIPYIFAGEDKIDLRVATEKLYKLFGIETLVMCGGAVINGAFFAENLVDEISLVISPYVEGDTGITIADMKGKSNLSAYGFAKAVEVDGHGVQVIFKRINF